MEEFGGNIRFMPTPSHKEFVMSYHDCPRLGRIIFVIVIVEWCLLAILF